MGLSGNLNTMPLADLLQWCKIGLKTGILTFDHEGSTKAVYLEEGKIVSATTNDPFEYLGQVLVSSGRISEDQLNQYFQERTRTGVLLGTVLMNHGLLSPQELQDILERKVAETVFDLFLWKAGTFHFKQRALADLNLLVRVELEVDYCVFEGVRRVDEWNRIKEVFPSDHMVLALGDVSPPDAEMTAETRRVLELVEGGRTIEEIQLELRGNRFAVLSQLFSLYQGGCIHITGKTKETETRQEVPRAGKFATEHQEIVFYYGRALPPTGIPKVPIDLDSLRSHRLSSKEAFVISRMNGNWDIQSIVTICPLQEIETLRILKRLLDERLITIE